MNRTDTAAISPILDPAILEDLRAIDASIVTDLVSTFVDDVPQRIVRIQEGVTSGDAESVSREAHGLKGSALAVGATRLAALCLALEQHARAGRTDHFAAPCAALEPSFVEVRSLLQAMC